MYRVFADGHVEYESLIGLRIFESEKEFRDFVGEGKPGQTRGVNYKAANQMGIGLLVCLIGTGITLVTYSVATSGTGGGRYLIAWGVILFGAIQFVIGLSNLYSTEESSKVRSDRMAEPTKEEALSQKTAETSASPREKSTYDEIEREFNLVFAMKSRVDKERMITHFRNFHGGSRVDAMRRLVEQWRKDNRSWR